MSRAGLRRAAARHGALLGALGMLLGGAPVHADSSEEGATLDPIVVSATRTPQASADLPLSIDSVSRAQIASGQLQVNLSESLIGVPGVSAENRQNYAQDLQISIRGFGARSSFGVRGVRLYADGIPGTMPDGQGQFSNFDLGSADHIEVLRGPFSALYGNSSGGVIALFTQDAPLGQRIDASAEYGSFQTQRYGLKEQYGTQDFNLVLDAAHFSTGGFRDHSAAMRNYLNGKARWQLDERSSLTFVVNAIDMPNAQDPLGLTALQLPLDAHQPGTGSLTYNTRKAVQQEQAGAHYERTVSDSDDLSAMLYGGSRDTRQFQAIPTTTEAVATSPGGVIVLGHGYDGIDVHLNDHRELAGEPLQTSVGVSYDNLDEARRGYNNFIGSTLGVLGALRAQSENRVYDFDQYLQMQWDPGARWRAEAGVRNSLIEVSSNNHLAAPGTTVESGVRFSALNPVAGLTFRAAAPLDLYGSFGRGWETPTLDEMAYRSTNGSLPGLNFALQPAHSDNYEAGAKFNTATTRATLAGFYIHTEDEVAVQANAAGRSVYENIPETQRRGIEADWQNSWGHALSSQLSYTYLQALTLAPYTSCLNVPCVPVSIAAGHRLPAVPAGAFYSGLTWQPGWSGLSLTAEAVGRAQIYANDSNTQAASGYWLFNLHAALEQQRGAWIVDEGLRIDNLLNRAYVGSVIVNETSSRYFEPEPGRSVYLMFTLAHR